MAIELNLAGIDEVLDPANPQQTASTTPTKLDLTGIDDILFPQKIKKPSPAEETYQPTETNWSLAGLNSIKEFYQKNFNKSLPVNVGQQGIHNKWGLNHKESADISIDPDSPEGQKLREYLRENKIPFLAFKGAVPGVSTGPHIHVGKPSHRTGETFEEGSTLDSNIKLDLSGIEDIINVTPEQLDISQVQEVPPILDLSLATDPNKIDFNAAYKETPTVLSWATKYNKPVIAGSNPYQAGPLIEAEFAYDQMPDTNTGIDYLLQKWNPEYADLNANFRAETHGLNLINVQNQEGFLTSLGNNQYKVQARPTRAAMALIEAYKTGGLEGYNATLNLINQQKQDFLRQNRVQQELIQKYKEDHPYASAFESAFEREVLSSTQLAQNLAYLGKAVTTGIQNGFDSQSYIDLMNQEVQDQSTIEQIGGGIYAPPDFAGQVIAGATGGIVALPRFLAAGRIFGSSGLPLMVYAENLHKGNRQASLAALPMAIMAGSMHGAGEFFGATSGTAAPLTRVAKIPGKFTKEDLSLFTEKIAQGPPVSIANLTPFERQLVLRGANALALEGASLVENPQQTFREAAANLVVGLTFPVGRAPRPEAFPVYIGEPFRPIEVRNAPRQLTGEGLPDLSQQLGQMRIPVPITKAPSFTTRGEVQGQDIIGRFKTIEQKREISPVIYPSAESPEVQKYAPILPTGERDISEPRQYVAETETGFQARGQGETVHLDLDTANLHLLDLKRTLENKTYRMEGDTLQTVLQKQQAIKNAISVLEQAIPEETKTFFAQNENVIRESLRTNQEARNAKEQFIQKRAERLTPNDVAPVIPDAPIVSTGTETTKELFAGKAGDTNVFTSQEKAHDILQNFFKIASQGTTRSTLVPYGDVFVRKAGDLAYLSAFYIEDFYHRGIVPTVDIVLNRLRTSLGNFGRHISDDLAKDVFQKGMEYYNANVADPFFSKMKQDATERLPNSFSAKQARDVLSLYKNEFDWTAGLEEFLTANEGKNISKNDLIDVLNKGQVRVEASIAKEIETGTREWAIQNRLSQIESRLDEISTAQTEGHYENPAAVDKVNRIKELEREQAKFYDAGNFDIYDQIEKEIDAIKAEPLPTEDVMSYFDKMNKEHYALLKEADALRTERNKIKQAKPIYSLERWRGGEKLELPGAKNSKEVKLITPLTYPLPTNLRIIKGEELNRDISEYTYPNGAKETFAGANKNDAIIVDENGIIRGISFGGGESGAIESYRTSIGKPQITYISSHFPEKNLVAHYRANDRTAITGERLYHGEEFQSDWAHDIRTRGIKYETNPELAIANAKKAGFESIQQEDGSWTITIDGKKVIPIITAREESTAWKNFLIGNQGVEPMPFMQHNWKELVLKRFLRDAVIAKDENGSYKYDGISWTTARQQLERYKGIIEGKHFRWRKNDDGTYSFDFSSVENPDVVHTPGTWANPHELQRISLERFAELTTPEAAQEVRDQEGKSGERYIIQNVGAGRPFYFGSYDTLEQANAGFDKLTPEKQKQARIFKEPFKVEHGQFSLKEAVELRSREGTYADYDVAYKNILSKIGKRFGAKYSEKEIQTGERLIPEGDPNDPKTLHRAEPIIQKIHSLEITPSMRRSLEKEGFPLYGTGGTESLKSSEIGVRNTLTTRQGFDQHRDMLVKSLEQTLPDPVKRITPEERAQFEQAILSANKEDLEAMQLMLAERKGTVFNSGLSPDALVDQVKLLYRGIKDFTEFSNKLIDRFGEEIKPFLSDLWKQAKETTKTFHEDEGGWFNLQLRRMQTEAEKEYRRTRKKTLYYDNYTIHRGIMNAQMNPKAGEVYNTIRYGQRIKNYFEHNVLVELKAANRYLRKTDTQPVADNIWIGNEQGKTYTDAELAAGDSTINRPALNTEQISAYKAIRNAVDRAIEIRKQEKLYSFQTRADELQNRLNGLTLGTTEYTNTLKRFQDINDEISKLHFKFERLKRTGYISTQRRGPIAAVTFDATGKIYQQFKTIKDAGIWLSQQEANGADPLRSEIYDIRIPQRLRAASAFMTPGQFEDLLDSAGIPTNTKEIEQLRDEVYSRFPSYGYELKRDFVRGYDRNWQFVVDSVANQAETYANSFYSRVAGEEAIKALNNTDLQKNNYDLYKVLQKYIDHEISSPERSKLARTLASTRKGVYLFQLGFDFKQLYLNAIAQPITQTYSYFARASANGQTLKGLEPEKYWMEGWSLAKKAAQDRLTGSSKTPIEFKNILDRLRAEGVISAEFNKSLLNVETDKALGNRIKAKTAKDVYEHWAGIFMRGGEITTRTHTAAEAYLVGKKFGLVGEELTNFIVRAIDATQSNPSRAEAPLAIRGSQNTGEVRKLLYQFNAFNHMWIENLALNIRADFLKDPYGKFKKGNLKLGGGATIRHLVPVGIIGGMSGLPLSGIAAGLYTLITGEDPRKVLHKYMNNHDALERMVLYGITQDPTLSSQLTPSAPFESSIKLGSSPIETITETLSASALPAVSTAGQILKGFDDLTSGRYLRAAGSMLPVKPLRNVAIARRYQKEGVRTRAGVTIVPKSQITPTIIIKQGLGIPPSKVTEYYNVKGAKQRTGTINVLRKRVKKLL